MSVKVMGSVWDSALPQEEKFVALAYADHADHDGSNVFPSNDLIAWKTGYSVRQVQRIRSRLIRRGILVPSSSNKGGRRAANHYFFNVAALPSRPDWKTTRAENHDKLTPFPQGNHDIPAETMTFDAENHDIAMSGESSLTINIEPSDSQKKEAKSPEEKAKERIIEAMASGFKNESALREELRAQFLLTPDWDVKSNRDFLLWLKQRPPGQELSEFAKWWWRSDWRGVQGQPPTLKQIRELWLNAFESVPLHIAAKAGNVQETIDWLNGAKKE